MVSGSDWLFGMESPSALNQPYNNAYWAYGEDALKSQLQVNGGLEASSLMEVRGASLESLLDNLLGKFGNVQGVHDAVADFSGAMRMVLSVKASDTKSILFVAGDTLERGSNNRYQADLRPFRCLERYLSKSTHGRAFHPSPEKLKKLNIKKERAWLQGLAWPNRFLELGFKSDPVNSIYATCGG